MMTALTKDSDGQKKIKMQADIDDLQFDKENRKRLRERKA
jgi:hypothetical protein